MWARRALMSAMINVHYYYYNYVIMIIINYDVIMM